MNTDKIISFHSHSRNEMRAFGRAFGALYLQPLIHSDVPELQSLVTYSYGIENSGKSTITEALLPEFGLSSGFTLMANNKGKDEFPVNDWFRFCDFGLPSNPRQVDMTPRRDIAQLPQYGRLRRAKRFDNLKRLRFLGGDTAIRGVDFLEHAPREHSGMPGATIFVQPLDNPIDILRRKKSEAPRPYFLMIRHNLYPEDAPKDETYDLLDRLARNELHILRHGRMIHVVRNSDHPIAQAAFSDLRAGLDKIAQLRL